MRGDTYKAAFWRGTDGSEVVLTGPEDASLSDAALMAMAMRDDTLDAADMRVQSDGDVAIVRAPDEILAVGTIVIGPWTE